MTNAERIRDRLRKSGGAGDGPSASQNQFDYVASLLNDCFEGQFAPDNSRRSVIRYLFGVGSAKQLTKRQASAIIEWQKSPDVDGENEAHILLNAALVETGQQSYFEDDSREEDLRIAIQSDNSTTSPGVESGLYAEEGFEGFD
jgi:hypothetical protein